MIFNQMTNEIPERTASVLVFPHVNFESVPKIVRIRSDMHEVDESV